jgi:hypothetical protein
VRLWWLMAPTVDSHIHYISSMFRVVLPVVQTFAPLLCEQDETTKVDLAVRNSTRCVLHKDFLNMLGRLGTLHFAENCCHPWTFYLANYRIL